MIAYDIGGLDEIGDAVRRLYISHGPGLRRMESRRQLAAIMADCVRAQFAIVAEDDNQAAYALAAIVLNALGIASVYGLPMNVAASRQMDYAAARGQGE